MFENILNKGMHLKQPATGWKDALPSGNGSIGALVYGNIKDEVIVLNHEALWLEKPRPEIKPMDKYIPEYRKLLLEGKYKEAELFFEEKFSESDLVDGGPDPYQPAFDIKIDTHTTASFCDYSGFLNFETGQATVSWIEQDVRYFRNLFTSRSDNAVILQISAENKKLINCEIALIPHNSEDTWVNRFGGGGKDENLPFTYQTTTEEDKLTFTAKYPNGKEFGGVARVIVKGGSSDWMEQSVKVRDADEVLLIVKLFVGEPKSIALTNLKKELNLISSNYEHLLREHVLLHGEMFNRVKLCIGEEEKSPLPNEELLLKGYGGQVPEQLIEKMFYYGRYLLISSSRPGGLPANLQGVWNGDYKPAWSSDYHNDENIQMNYWPALPGNLTETTLPYFDYYESMLDDFRTNAKAVYGCRGILTPIAQSTHGLIYGNGMWSAWTAGAGWLAQLYYDYWLFTEDGEFLRNRAVPFLKEVALFYEDFLIEDDNGKLMFIPSLSPENMPAIEDPSLVTINATMDVAIAREVLTNLCNACEYLGIYKNEIRKWKKLRDKLPEYEINEDGAIKEWIHPDLKDNYHHRHQSHIYPVFPGFEVTEEKAPKLFEAFRVAVEKRLVVGLTSQTGWSLGHMANIFARLGDGNRALECLELLCRSCVGTNLFTYHNDWRSQGITMFLGYDNERFFQIDANFGYTAAILEMLAFSEPGMIKVLPALPDKWKKGNVEGIRCRGNVELYIAWNMETKVIRVILESQADKEITIKFPFAPASVKYKGCDITDSSFGKQYRQVSLHGNVGASIIVKRS